MTDHYTPEDIDRAAELGDLVTYHTEQIHGELLPLQQAYADLGACPASPMIERELFPTLIGVLCAFSEVIAAVAESGDFDYPDEADRLRAALAALTPAAQHAINALTPQPDAA